MTDPEILSARLCLICRSTFFATDVLTCPYSADHIATLADLIQRGLVRKP